MNRRGTGAIFCLIGSLLFAARYITAAIFMSNASSWDSLLFAAGLEYQGDGLLISPGERKKMRQEFLFLINGGNRDIILSSYVGNGRWMNGKANPVQENLF